MTQQGFEMPDDYKNALAHLQEFLEARDGFRAQMKAAHDRGLTVSPADQALFDKTLKEFDEKIDGLEQMLADEYDRYQAEQRKAAELSKLVAEGWEMQKHLYIMIKHEMPHLLESFTKDVLSPLPDDMREEFFDDVAVLEATKLDAILKGEA